MKKLLIVLGFAACTTGSVKEQNSLPDSSEIFQPHVERLSPALDAIIAADTKVEIIAEGFDWTEGPLWIDGLGLIFSDIPPNEIYLWTQDEGHKLYLKPSGYTGSVPRGGEIGSNGLLLDHQGKLILCQHGDRRVARMLAGVMEPEPVFETVADQFEGKKFNSPNDACYHKNGALYFTDPAYGLEYRMDDPLKELDFQGVYRYTETAGPVLLTDELSRPNGIAFSPDFKKLYVANSDPEKAIWMEYAIDENGDIVSGRIFHDATELIGKEKGLPDGLKVDSMGNIFASGPGGIWIFDDSGKVLGKIKTGQATSNCAIGNQGTMLYITADMYVMRVGLI